MQTEIVMAKSCRISQEHVLQTEFVHLRHQFVSKDLQQGGSDVDVLISLTSDEAKLFREKKLHLLSREKSFKNILPNQRVYVCLGKDMFHQEEYGVLGELKGFTDYTLQKNKMLWTSDYEEIRSSQKAFRTRAENYYSEDWVDTFMLQPPSWAMVIESNVVFSEPRKFEEFLTRYGNPLRNAPQEMMYVSQSSKERHGLCMTKEEFIYGNQA